MSGFTSAAGISPTTVTTSAQAPLGFEMVAPDGDNGLKTYVYIKAGAPIAAKQLVTRDSAGGNAFLGAGAAAAATSAMNVLGVSEVAIAANSYGFVCKSGVTTAVGDGSVAAGEPIVASAAVGAMVSGLAGAGADTTAAIGVALSSDGGVPADISVLLKL
jgi:hypothetical protein|tara:strand:+ start:661 stop:1140 length:480 start_codon:yes stop_codon:yes gene_type:complete